MLARMGFWVEGAVHGGECLDRIEEHPYALVFMDLQMPVMDGFETARRLRALGIRIPIVAVTAFNNPGEKERCFETGMDEYVVKPIRIQIIRELLRRFLKRRSPGNTVSRGSVLVISRDREWGRSLLSSLEAANPPFACRFVSDAALACTLLGEAHTELVMLDRVRCPMDPAALIRLCTTSRRYRKMKIWLFLGKDPGDSGPDRAAGMGVDAVFSRKTAPDLLVGRVVREIESGATPTRFARKRRLPLLERVARDLELNVEDCREILDVFFNKSHFRLRAIEQAVESGDLESLERLAHSLKGSSANLGLKRIERSARRLERFAGKKDRVRLRELCLRLRENFEKTARAALR
jgi:CheY-like chemotaxis protein/HPt (histidine-containing phosphotransfer) domain-containing protein